MEKAKKTFEASSVIYIDYIKPKNNLITDFNFNMKKSIVMNMNEYKYKIIAQPKQTHDQHNRT